MHECRVVLILLFEHAFWMWEVAGLSLLDKLSIACVCVHVCLHICMMHAGGGGDSANLVSEGLSPMHLDSTHFSCPYLVDKSL